MRATGFVRDLTVLADKVDPGAVADRALVTLVAGDSAVVTIASGEDCAARGVPGRECAGVSELTGGANALKIAGRHASTTVQVETFPYGVQIVINP